MGALPSPAEKQDDHYYDMLFDSLETELPAFLFFLKNRDLSGFSPNARPPMTDSKMELIALSEAPLRTTIRELIDGGGSPFHRDLVTLDQVRDAIVLSNNFYSRNPSVSQVAETLLNLGASQLGQQRIEGLSSKPSLWAIRNAELWREAKITERTAEFTKVETAT